VGRGQKSDDEIFKAAKNKIGDMIKTATTVEDVVSLCNTLSKMKAVELKMGEDDWGSGLPSPPDEKP